MIKMPIFLKECRSLRNLGEAVDLIENNGKLTKTLFLRNIKNPLKIRKTVIF